MTRHHIALILIILLEIFLLCLGCHSSGNNAVIPPTEPGSEQMITDDVVNGGGRYSGGNVANTPAMWGLYEVVYDPGTHLVEVIPLRGPAFALNVVHFLQPPAGSADNLLVNVLDDSTFLQTGRIDVRVMLHHPFPGMPVFDGFDVCGILLTEGSVASPYNSSLTYADPDADPTLLNPDGYTRWMNPSEFLTGNIFGYIPGVWGTSESSENSGFIAGATINPYKYFSQGLAPDQSLSEFLEKPDTLYNRGIFPSGASCARDYELLFPLVGGWPSFIFNYAVLANWAEPTVNPPVDPYTDFPPEANAQYPLHIFATDESRIYYTPDEAGGELKLEIEIFDWDALKNPEGIPGEVASITAWSNSPLIPGGYVKWLSTDVEWNSGFTASTSIAQVEMVGAVPEADGYTPVWIEIESAHPSSYDQGFDADVPSDPLASYVTIPVDVRNCPKAFITGMDQDIGGRHDYLDDVLITGSNILQGDDLGIWLEGQIADDSADPNDPVKIYGSDVKYVDSNHISADFDLTDAPVGVYGVGCINGCGLITEPDENNTFIGEPMEFKITLPTPSNLQISTGRDTYLPEAVTHLLITWDPVEFAEIYYVHVTSYDINSSVLYSGEITGTINTEYMLDLYSVYLTHGGALEIWVTAYGILDSDGYESLSSTHAYMYYQNFESSMGAWKTISENQESIRFVRSAVEAGFNSMWGLKSLGQFQWTQALWTAFVSPPIPDHEDATTVHFEFLHKHKGILSQNGYQVGWVETLPYDYQPEVEGYYPITSATYGYNYNDTASSALQSEFGVSASTDDNFGINAYYWTGWHLSGFDASSILGNEIDDYLVIGLAGDYYDQLEVNIDEVAILVY